jgi:hypothetical protein
MTQLMIIIHRRSLFYIVIEIQIIQRKEKKVNVLRYNFEMIVEKTYIT